MERDEFLYREARTVLRDQLADVDELDKKTNTLLAVNGVLALLFVNVAIYYSVGAGLAGLAGVLFSLVGLLISYRVGDWRATPGAPWLAWNSENETPVWEVCRDALEGVGESYTINEGAIAAKANAINRGARLMLFGVCGCSAGALEQFAGPWLTGLFF